MEIPATFPNEDMFREGALGARRCESERFFQQEKYAYPSRNIPSEVLNFRRNRVDWRDH
jgi:hypothetical protein